MKKLLLLFILFASVSCNKSPDISKIKQRVFGNLVLGSKLSEYKEIQDSLLRTKGMELTSYSNYPYFQINKRGFSSQTILLLFPSIYYNTDSVITKIAYFVYSSEFISEAALDNPGITQQQISALIDGARKTREKYDLLTETFTTTNEVDKKYGYNIPNLAQGLGYDNYGLRNEIGNFLQEKYGVPNVTDTTGDQYDWNDYSYSNESIWKTDYLNIKLVTRKFPTTNTNSSNHFYHVLLYEFNEDVMKKYKLNKHKDLTKTF